MPIFSYIDVPVSPSRCVLSHCMPPNVANQVAQMEASRVPSVASRHRVFVARYGRTAKTKVLRGSMLAKILSDSASRTRRAHRTLVRSMLLRAIRPIVVAGPFHRGKCDSQIVGGSLMGDVSPSWFDQLIALCHCSCTSSPLPCSLGRHDFLCLLQTLDFHVLPKVVPSL